jgi:hypothetical protein
MKASVAATAVLYIATAEACLTVTCDYQSAPANIESVCNFFDDGPVTCTGNCWSTLSCNLDCETGYSATVQNEFSYFTYNTPHGDYTFDASNNMNVDCCGTSEDGTCILECFSYHVDQSYFPTGCTQPY